MSPTEPGQRNRSLLDSLLSTRAPRDGAAALLHLADVLEARGYVLSGWQVDGPDVRVNFHGPGSTLSATVGELERAAKATVTGDPSAWQSLLLQDGSDPGGRGPHLPETLP